MDFDQLKKLAKKLGGILVLDGNELEFVILPYDQYEKETSTPDDSGGNSGENMKGPDEEEEKTIEKLNREILALKEEIHQKESAELIENTRGEESVADVIDFE